MRLSRRELPMRSRGTYRARVLKWVLSVAFISLLTFSMGIFHLLMRSFADGSLRTVNAHREGNNQEARVLEQQIPRLKPVVGGSRIQGRTWVEDSKGTGDSTTTIVRGDSIDVNGTSADVTTVTSTTTVTPNATTTTKTTTEEDTTPVTVSSSHSDSGNLYMMTIGSSHYCILPGACRTYQGGWIFPDWLARYSHSIAKCGFPVDHMSYYTIPPMTGAAHEQLDLVSTRFHRYHFPHFLQDAFNTVTLFNLLYNPLPDLITTSMCRQRDGECQDGSAPPSTGWKPTVPLESKVSTMNTTSWVRSFLRLLPNRDSSGPAEAFLEELYPDKDQSPPACFRNVIEGMPSHPSLTVPTELAAEKNILFSANSIDKKPRTECPLQVMVLDRVHTGSPTSGRFFPEGDVLAEAIRSEAEKRGLAVEVQLVNFDNASFTEQIQRMNSVDLCVSVHGAELTNIVWMRPKAHVVEIMPFQWEPDLFEGIANFVSVSVERIVAKPDVNRFEACLRVYNEKSGMEGSLATIEEFQKSGETFLTTGVPGPFNPNPPDVKMCSPCLRAQSLLVDNTYVARRAVAKLELRCPL